jgi:hypothetical protein
MQTFIEIYCQADSQSLIPAIIADEQALSKKYKLKIISKKPFKAESSLKYHGNLYLVWHRKIKILSLIINYNEGNNPYLTAGNFISYLKTNHPKDIKVITIL